jgi:hypothetical protein
MLLWPPPVALQAPQARFHLKTIKAVVLPRHEFMAKKDSQNSREKACDKALF